MMKYKDIDNVRIAAKREHKAEQSRVEAETAWRAAWWETTLALAKPDNRAEVTEVLTVAAEILGHSRKHLTRRRAVGQAKIGNLEVTGLPPRLTMEWVLSGRPLNDVAISEILTAEQDGVSLREFAAQIGTKVDAWQSQDERREAPASLAQVQAALADPVVAHQVVANPALRAVLNRALVQHYDHEHGLRRAETPITPTSEHDHVVEVLVRLRAITVAIKSATDVVLSGPQIDAIDDLVTAIDWQINALNIVRDALSKSGMDAELAAILREG